MGSQSLYRKYRSRSLDEVVGQEHITALLGRAIKNGHISHAYLMTGPHGVGKTSIARILAHEINDLPYSDESTHLDIIEIDAASNNGVEDVRDLRERVHVAPTTAKRKVYIIDEVHMLSKPAFNALLKTLEEPPEHVVFILATTDADKLPATIISRVQRFNFRTIDDVKIQEHLRMIADKESIHITDEALERIVQHGHGSFRDSITLLDQLRSVSETEITAADVLAALGAPDEEHIEALLAGSMSGDITTIVATLEALETAGVSATVTADSLIRTLRTRLHQPQAIILIDRLIDVSRSPYPFVKLLTVLASFAPPVVAVPAPTAKPIARPPTAAALEPKPKTEKTTKKPDASQPQPPTPPVQAGGPLNFDWDKFLAALSDTAVAALLKKAGHSFGGSTLTIYAGNKFNAGKLSGERLAKLHGALETIGATGVTIEIRPDPAPPSDSRLSAIADIMGGGEEVVVDGD